MSDLTGKTITIPADLGGHWTPTTLRGVADKAGPAAAVLHRIADEVERQQPAEPPKGSHITARLYALGSLVELVRTGTEAVPGHRGDEWVVVADGERYCWDDLIERRPVGR